MSMLKFLQLSFWGGIVVVNIKQQEKTETETKTSTIQQLGILTMNFNKPKWWKTVTILTTHSISIITASSTNNMQNVTKNNEQKKGFWG